MRLSRQLDVGRPRARAQSLRLLSEPQMQYNMPRSLGRDLETAKLTTSQPEHARGLRQAERGENYMHHGPGVDDDAWPRTGHCREV